LYNIIFLVFHGLEEEGFLGVDVFFRDLEGRDFVELEVNLVRVER
jgi:hypothetical protein